MTTPLDPTTESSVEVEKKPARRSRLLLIPVVLISLLILFFVAIQFVPVNRTNPAVTVPIKWDSAQTETLARQACMDCHSYETNWPWYSHVAPVSWLVYYDVERGRSQLNFSTLSTTSGQFRGNPFTQNSNDLAYQLGQILAGQGGGLEGQEGFSSPGGQRGFPPDGQFPTLQPGGQRGFPPGGQFPTLQPGAQPGQGLRSFGGGGGITNRLTESFQNNQMPPANYLLLHPSASLTEDQKQQLLAGLLATFGLSSSQ